MSDIHPSAIIGEGVTLGTGCTVGPFAVIESGAVIGDGCSIHPHVTIGPKVHLGPRVQVFPGAAVGMIPQTKPQPEHPGGVTVGADTVIRECVTLNAATTADAVTRIDERCLLMAYVHAGHDSVVEDDVILANGVTLAGHVTVEQHATISAMVPVHQFVRVGAYSYTGGGFRIVQDVPPYVMAGGEPLTPHGLNSVGLRRNGFTDEQMNRLKKIYRHFYRSGLNTAQALSRADELEDCAEKRAFVHFIEQSSRGIIK